ncbi:Dihydrofolate reductase [Rosistilla carotiformis]|uniref:Dihydrofolate reductase n=1 Tax=Rosistilla carotiformis TaxID=2528017 RepID=A0A518JU41_9BACT|nr:dihydrofolate reductase family protein [Rosistilla carotiformis]QDV69062.1 Dihydrofolate reductase [Rosistilla carotiformis]
MANRVFIATSLDGFISDRDGALDWLHSVPNPDNLDFGYAAFMEQIDAIVMGRKTFGTVCGFDCDWPYTKPVFVLSKSLTSLPDGYEGKAELITGSLGNVIATLHEKGHQELYIDGGSTIQSFLKEDLIDEMIITVLPILLGGGARLFGELSDSLAFEHVKTEVPLNSMVQNHYRRRR